MIYHLTHNTIAADERIIVDLSNTTIPPAFARVIIVAVGKLLKKEGYTVTGETMPTCRRCGAKLKLSYKNKYCPACAKIALAERKAESMARMAATS